MPNSKLDDTEKTKRVTFIFPPILDQALEFYCRATQQQKSKVMATALAEYLSKNNDQLCNEFEVIKQFLGVMR